MTERAGAQRPEQSLQAAIDQLGDSIRFFAGSLRHASTCASTRWCRMLPTYLVCAREGRNAHWVSTARGSALCPISSSAQPEFAHHLTGRREAERAVDHC